MENRKVLENCRLFQGCESGVIDLALEMSEERVLSKSETLCSERGIYIIVSGEIGVYHSDQERRVLLNMLSVSNVFGYASLYSAQDDRYTQIIAVSSCKLLYIDAASVEKLILMDGKIALEVIKELTGKIRFLNKKLDSFASVDLKRRLWKYLKSLRYDSEGRAQIPESMSALARRLGVGRASLYRLITELTSEGLIERQGNEIIMKKTADNKTAEDK